MQGVQVTVYVPGVEVSNVCTVTKDRNNQMEKGRDLTYNFVPV